MATAVDTRYVYDFADGSREMRVLLGDKGSNIAEMTRALGPERVPAGFTITAEACLRYSTGPWWPARFLRDVAGFAVPAGVAVGAAVLAAYLAALHGLGFSVAAARTVVTTVMLAGMLFLIVALESGRPAAPPRRAPGARARGDLRARPRHTGRARVLRPEPEVLAASAAGAAVAWVLATAALRITAPLRSGATS
jgi:hypothetical protein